MKLFRVVKNGVESVSTRQMRLAGLVSLLLAVVAAFLRSAFTRIALLLSFTQLAGNVWVFLAFFTGFFRIEGKRKVFALIGAIPPVIIGGLTIVYIIWPVLKDFIA